jgi:hypothetical protein
VSSRHRTFSDLDALALRATPALTVTKILLGVHLLALITVSAIPVWVRLLCLLLSACAIGTAYLNAAELRDHDDDDGGDDDDDDDIPPPTLHGVMYTCRHGSVIDACSCPVTERWYGLDPPPPPPPPPPNPVEYYYA